MTELYGKHIVLEVVQRIRQFSDSNEHILNGTTQLYKSAKEENIEAGKQQFAQIFLHHFCNVSKRKKKQIVIATYRLNI